MSDYKFGYSCYDEPNADSSYPHEKTVTVTARFHEDGTWPSVLSEFCNFLSTVFGYSVKDNIYVDCFANKLDAHFKHPEDYEKETKLGKPQDGWDEDDEWEAFKQWQASRSGDDE